MQFILEFDGSPDDTTTDIYLGTSPFGNIDSGNITMSSCFDSNPDINNSNQIVFNNLLTDPLSFAEYFGQDCTLQDTPGQPYTIVLGEFTVSGNAGECVTFDQNITFSLDPNPNSTCLTSTSLTGEYCFEGTTISGTVAPACADASQYNHSNSSNVSVSIEDTNTGHIYTDITDTNGMYSIEVCEGGNYNIVVDEVCETHCDISTFDLVLYTEYILGRINPDFDDFPVFESIFFSEMNSDGYVTTFDVVLTRQYILGQLPPDYLPPSGSFCNFVPNSVVDNYEQIIANGGDYSNTENISVPTTGGSVSGVDFTVFALGDASCSCGGDNINLTPDDETTVTIQGPDRNGEYTVSAGETKAGEVVGLAFDLPRGVDVASFTGYGMDWDYGIVDGTLKMIGLNTASQAPTFVPSGQPMVRFRLSDPNAQITLSSKSSDNVLLSSNGTIFGITEAPKGNPKSSDIVPPLQVTQSGSTLYIDMAGFEGATDIRMYDLLGQVVFFTQQTVTENNLQIPLSLTEGLPSHTGVYILSVTDGQRLESKKVYWR